MTRARSSRLAPPFRRATSLALAAAIPALCFVPRAAPAINVGYTWTNNGNDSLWSNSLNWSPNGIPSANDSALINISSGSIAASNTVFYNYTGANVTLSQLTVTHAASKFGTLSVLSIGANALNATNENIGDSTLGGPLASEIDQSGNSTNNVVSNLTLGRNSADNGYYNLSGNGSLQAGNEIIALSGHANFTQSGGNNTLFSPTSGFYLAMNTSASANYSLSGGDFSSIATEHVGYGGTATFTQTGGLHIVGDSTGSHGGLNIGELAGSNGTYILTGSSPLLALQAPMIVGVSGNGTFTQDLGRVEAGNTVRAALALAFNAGAFGTYNLSNNGLLSVGDLTVGQAGTGLFNHNDGSVYAANLTIAAATNSHGSYLFSQGVLSATGTIYIGDHGNATFTQTGGTVIGGPDLGIYLGNSSDGSGNYTLSGGTLSASSIFVGFAGHGTFTLSGGTLNTVGPEGVSVTSSSTFIFSGGSLQVPAFSSFGTFSRTGGTLDPTAFAVQGGTSTFQNVNTQLTNLTFTGSTNSWFGKLDITNTKFVIQPTAAAKSALLANLTNQALYGRTHNAGITDSVLPAGMAVAVIDNASLPLPLTTFGGIAVDANSILLSQELLGDANIDGRIDLTDLALVLNNFGQSNTNWTAGNFDGAATIDAADLNFVLNNFGRTNTNATTSQSPGTNYQFPAPSPEPGSLAFLLPALIIRRRPRSI